ncbi:hypothetical protein Tco_0853943 [Tanacetum coccineum]
MTMSIPSQDKPLTNRAVESFMTETLKNPGHYYRTSPSMTMKVGTTQAISLSWSRQSLCLKMSKPTQVNKITTSCEICSGPHDTQYCMEDPEQAFVEYASSRIDKAGEGLVSNFMASQEARLSKFEADFKHKKSEMTNKIDTVLKAITDRLAGALLSDTIKNPILNVNTITSVLSARSYPTEDLQCLTHIHCSINAIIIHPKQQSDSHDDEPGESKEEEKDRSENTDTNPSASLEPSISFITEKVRKLHSFFKSLGLIVKKNDDSRKEEPEAGGLEVEYFDIFPTRSEFS